MADCLTACASSCTTTCSGGCQGDCSGCRGCTGCSGTCEGSCKGGCNTGCRNGCKGTCVADCEKTCNTSCKSACYNSCNGECKGYCSKICQTYCQTEQNFSQNYGEKNSPSTGAFSWSNLVEKDATIKITAKDWNSLKIKIQKATKYCIGNLTTPVQEDVSSNDPITADLYNDLANGIEIKNVTNNQNEKSSLITAEVINALMDGYNSLKFKTSLPNGQYTGGQNDCCQSGQICMVNGQLLDHQVCGDQSESSCGDQSAHY